MPYDARHIANGFIRRAAERGRVLSIMQLLKLVYIAHGWNLALYGQPLIKNRIEAWQHGPVIPDVYSAFRGQGIDVRDPVAVSDQDIDPQTNNILDQIFDIYGDMSPFKLSDITHVRNGPWYVASQRGGNYAHISDDLIKRHYDEKRRRSVKGGAIE